MKDFGNNFNGYGIAILSRIPVSKITEQKFPTNFFHLFFHSLIHLFLIII